MKLNNSPWIQQLKRTRPIDRMTSNMTADVAVVGAGIAGISTAYFTLKYTNKKVVLIEAGKVAHGATGHNAGQIVSYFERQISDIAKEFGQALAAEAQSDIDSAWDLLAEMYADAKFETPFHQFTGYAGSSDFDEIMIHIRNSSFSEGAHINNETLMIAEEWELRSRIPKEYEDLYSVVPQRDILSLLETEDTRYVAAVSARKGVMNSALFCEEAVGYLLSTYPDRFILREESPMSEVSLEKDQAVLVIGDYTVTANRVVLCTNGFEHFSIINKTGEDIDGKFHHLVRGVVGYMAAYLEEYNKPPTAISYLGDKDFYFYLTRRPFEDEKNIRHNLICIGGPEIHIEDTNRYIKDEHLYPEKAEQDIDDFVHTTCKFAPKEKIAYTHEWHGLMGYTPNGIRRIGTEPLNPVLLYNLGCNGVGILPSIHGGRRIARILAGEKLLPSIFDPKMKE